MVFKGRYEWAARFFGLTRNSNRPIGLGFRNRNLEKTVKINYFYANVQVDERLYFRTTVIMWRYDWVGALLFVVALSHR